MRVKYKEIFFVFWLLLLLLITPCFSNTSLIDANPDQSEYIGKFTYEIIQAANLSNEIKRAKFFIIVSHKRLGEAIEMAKKDKYGYVRELIKAYKDCLTLGIQIYEKLKERENKEEVLPLLEKCLFKNVVDLTYLIRNSPKEYRDIIQKSLNYTLNKRKEVEKIIKEIKKDKNKSKENK